MLRLLNFRCSFCSNPLDETQEFAHLGATAQAIPRPEPGRTATVSILAVPCHRDEIPAHDIAAALATRFGGR